MPQFYDEIPNDPTLVKWIQNQKVFHVATAPLNGGNVNVSPKGQPSFKLVNKKACWYLDLTGSGNETISHLYEPGNGRITLLFQAFEGPPKVVRIFGKGKVFERGSSEFDTFFDQSANSPAVDDYEWPVPEFLAGARAVIWIDITRVSTSRGYSVPLMEFVSHRDTLNQWASQLEEGDLSADDPYKLPYTKGLKQWHASMNTWSINGLPGLKEPSESASRDNVKEAMKDHNFRTSDQLSARRGKHAAYHPAAMLVLGLSVGVFATSFIRDKRLLASWSF